MPWYRSGTVTVTNGSPTITGADTDFVANAQIGHGFRGPDGRTYEIGGIVSATELTLAEPYLSASGGGQTYAIQPTSSLTRDLAVSAAQLLNTFAVVRDTVGQGLFPDGTVAAPGIRFGADQDTGWRRSGANGMSAVTGGQDRMTIGEDGSIVTATDPGGDLFNIRFIRGVAGSAAGTLKGKLGLYYGAGTEATAIDFMRGSGANDGVLAMRTQNAERVRIDGDGNLLVGVTAGSDHAIRKSVPQGSVILRVVGESAPSGVFVAVGGYNPGATGAALYLGQHSATGRSLNAGGTINGSGADYAEYLTKAAGCGTIAKGDVCGVDSDGRLTKTWADARSFVIKSTDPGIVLGDAWGQSVGPRPEGPGEEPAAPIAPPGAPASEDEAAVDAWRAIVTAYPAQLAAYKAAHEAWEDTKAAYDEALPAWEAALEAERQKVDRIAFTGQVPVNVSGDFAVGDYLIAAANGAGIKAVAVPADTITFEQYRRRLGKVWAVRDDRAWVDVQHG